MKKRWVGWLAVVVCGAATACSGGGGGNTCGPANGIVQSIVDGDTIDLASGERVRYLMVDTPEISGGTPECYGTEARDFNSSLVLGLEVQLEYDVECEDRFGRLLAYVSLGDREVNSLLVERGFACVLYIPPNGTDRRAEFESLEATAEGTATGMWGDCQEVPCAN